MTKKLLSLVLALLLVLSVASVLAEESAYGPIADGDVTLTIWYPMEDQAAPYIDTIEDNITWAEIERRLGIQLKFIQVPAASRAEMFQLMIASDELPDIIQYQNDYIGGGEKAVKDGVFIAINDYLDEYLPDYKARMLEDDANAMKSWEPDAEKGETTDNARVRDCMEDSGLMYWLKNIMSRRQASYCGMMIRGDWLEELNLEMPTTYGELHDVLVAFKENCTGGEAPLELYQDGFGVMHSLCGGFGFEADPTTNDWFFYDTEKDEVVCSVFTDGFKRYVETMAAWYKEGLIDPNYTTNISSYGNPERIGSGKTGVYQGLFTQAGKYYANTGVLEEDAYFDLIPMLVENEGDERKIAQFRPSSVNTNGFVVTTACENVEVALRFINYLYTAEGSLLANYGMEGETYYVEDGKPYVNDLIKNNPQMNLSGSRFAYLVRNVGQYTYRDVEDDAVDEFQQKYMTVWDNSNYGDTMIVQQYLSYTADEAKEFAAIMSDASTYILEWTNRFITGVESLENWDSFMNGLNGMGLERATELCADAYGRYMARSL